VGPQDMAGTHMINILKLVEDRIIKIESLSITLSNHCHHKCTSKYLAPHTAVVDKFPQIFLPSILQATTPNSSSNSSTNHHIMH
jgi:hypothetical protein